MRIKHHHITGSNWGNITTGFHGIRGDKMGAQKNEMSQRWFRWTLLGVDSAFHNYQVLIASAPPSTCLLWYQSLGWSLQSSRNGTPTWGVGRWNWNLNAICEYKLYTFAMRATWRRRIHFQWSRANVRFFCHFTRGVSMLRSWQEVGDKGFHLGMWWFWCGKRWKKVLWPKGLGAAKSPCWPLGPRTSRSRVGVEM